MEKTESHLHKLDYPDAFSKMSEEEIEQWKKKALTPPDSFAYFGGDDEMFATWSLGPMIESRDSPIIDKANAQSIKDTLREDASLSEDWRITECSHWAVGWVNHLSFRVIDESGSVSRVARIIKELYNRLETYSVLDDELLCDMELEATLWNIKNHWKRSSLKDELPDGWEDRMYMWWVDQNIFSPIENIDGHGGCQSDEEFEKCARALGFWNTDDDDEEE